MWHARLRRMLITVTLIAVGTWLLISGWSAVDANRRLDQHAVTVEGRVIFSSLGSRSGGTLLASFSPLGPAEVFLIDRDWRRWTQKSAVMANACDLHTRSRKEPDRLWNALHYPLSNDGNGGPITLWWWIFHRDQIRLITAAAAGPGRSCPARASWLHPGSSPVPRRRRRCR